MSPFPCNKAIEEGGNNYCFLFLQYKLLPSLLCYKEKKKEGFVTVTFFVAQQQNKKKKVTAA
jgi:hypothetical protein